MDKETEIYYDNYLDLFQSKGWKQLTEDLTQQAGLLNIVTEIKDSEDLRIRQGQLHVLHNLLNLPEQVEFALKELHKQGDLNSV